MGKISVAISISNDTSAEVLMKFSGIDLKLIYFQAIGSSIVFKTFESR